MRRLHLGEFVDRRDERGLHRGVPARVGVRGRLVRVREQNLDSLIDEKLAGAEAAPSNRLRKARMRTEGVEKTSDSMMELVMISSR